MCSNQTPFLCHDLTKLVLAYKISGTLGHTAVAISKRAASNSGLMETSMARLDRHVHWVATENIADFKSS
jgi:hypothetical protein